MLLGVFRTPSEALDELTMLAVFLIPIACLAHRFITGLKSSPAVDDENVEALLPGRKRISSPPHADAQFEALLSRFREADPDGRGVPFDSLETIVARQARRRSTASLAICQRSAG